MALRVKCSRARGLILALLVMELCVMSEHVTSQIDTSSTGQRLSYGFYATRCPQAELTVRDVMQEFYLTDQLTAPTILRILFHDCFVQGCDASILLNTIDPNAPAEKDALPNANLQRGFQLIDDIKGRIETYCPQVVSCADIIALAARESIVLTGGPRFPMPTGRRDATISVASRALNDLIPPDADLNNITASFRSKGLNQADVVALLGAHTIGRTHCMFAKNRVAQIWPCSHNSSNIIELDIGSGRRFDNNYYVNLRRGDGVLISDDALLSRLTTYRQVTAFAFDNELFLHHFIISLIKMSSIHVLTGQDGEVRQNCSFVNSPGPLNDINGRPVPRGRRHRHTNKTVVVAGSAQGSIF